MKAIIEFEVESEEEFNKLKDSSKLPKETWTLLNSNAIKLLEELIDRRDDCFIPEDKELYDWTNRVKEEIQGGRFR